jgi:hypothetical protein
MPGKRRIAIVFESTDDEPLGKGEGFGFSVHMEGHDSDRMKRPDEELDGVEWWARRTLQLVVGALRRGGAVASEKPRKPSGGQG